jgi:hypothetical protein
MPLSEGGRPSSGDPFVQGEQRNARIGWSSIAFGATPVWPWLKSKKATPVTVAKPGQLRTARRAEAI